MPWHFRPATAAARQILACYGPLVAPGVILRGLRIESVVPPPSRGLHYLAHLANAQATVSSHRRMELSLRDRRD